MLDADRTDRRRRPTAPNPVISRDGRVVAFTSTDQGLAPAVVPAVFGRLPDADLPGRSRPSTRTGVTTSPVGIDDHHRQRGGRARARRSPVSASSFAPTMSADGHLIAFVTKATNLQLVEAAGGGEATDGDLLIADRTTGRLTRLTVSADGVRPAVAAQRPPASQRHRPHGRVRHAGGCGTRRVGASRLDAPSSPCRARRVWRSPKPISGPPRSASPATSGTSR